MATTTTSDGGFPHWAIAVISVLGGLLLLGTLAAAYLVLRHVRKRRDSEGYPRPSTDTKVSTEPDEKNSLLGRRKLIESGSNASAVDEPPLVSGSEAAIMANAFRKALRQPEFTSIDPNPSSGEGEQVLGNEPREDVLNKRDSLVPTGEAKELMDKELASEGRSVRSVDRRKPVKIDSDVET